MTLKEFREIVAESQHNEYLENLSISIPYAKLNEPIKLNGITNIYRFFKAQAVGWDKIDIELPEELKKVKAHFEVCTQKICSLLKNAETKGIKAIEQEWNNIFTKLKAHQFGSNIKVLLYDSPHLDYLIKNILHEYPDSFKGAYDYLIWDRVEKANLNNKPEESKAYFRGVTLAYEFELQDHTEIIQRRSNEKKSLGQIRSNFEYYLSEVESSTTDYLKKTKEKFENHSDKIDELKEFKHEQINVWFNNTKDTLEKFDAESHDKIKELEKLYTEKLRLDAPVDYWSKRALWMNIFSGVSISLLISVVGAGVWILYSLLTEDLEIYNVDNIFGDTGALKWSIIYITLFSFLAYLVRTIGKVSFSFLHLARDAEERKQLTYVYLALSEESVMSKEDREIVLQSIFSRADTGLLKGDSSPTMPGIILEKFTGRGQ